MATLEITLWILKSEITSFAYKLILICTVRRYIELENKLASVDLDIADLAKLGKELSSLSRLVELSDRRLVHVDNINGLKAIELEEGKKNTSDGDEMVSMALAEREEAELALLALEDEIIVVLTPKDEADDRNVVIEVRAGTGTLHHTH